MQQPQVDITTLSIDDLKKMGFDMFLEKEKLSQQREFVITDLNLVLQEIAKRESAALPQPKVPPPPMEIQPAETNHV